MPRVPRRYAVWAKRMLSQLGDADVRARPHDRGVRFFTPPLERLVMSDRVPSKIARYVRRFLRNMGGEDIRGARGIDSDSVSTESATVTNEVDAGSVSTESATVTNEVDAGSVNTEQTQIDGRLIRQMEVYEPSSASSSVERVQFSGLGEHNYLLRFDIDVQESSPSDLRMYFNENDAEGNGDYLWVDQTGTKQTSEDQIVLGQFNDDRVRIQGHVIVSGVAGHSAALRNNLAPSVTERVDEISQYGGASASFSSDLLSIELDVPGVRSGDSIELWRWV